MTALAPGYVALHCDDPALRLVVLLGEDPVRITGGAGGWDVTARPQQVGMTTWNGSEPLQASLALMFDGWARETGQERALRRLLTVARGDDESPPGVIEIEGVPLLADRDWVIEGIDYGDVIVDASSRKRLRQALTLTLREYVPPTFLQLRRRALSANKAKTAVITAHKGDTPAKIARRQHCKWTDLRTLNPKAVKKANQALTAGIKLRVPVAKAKDRKAKGGQKGTTRARSRTS
jgi:hypothetical protein